MLLKIDGYDLGEEVYSLALDEYTCFDLMINSTSFMFLRDNTLIFHPQSKKIVVSDLVSIKLSQCDNYDVFYISSDGIAFQYYSNESIDNALLITNKCNSNCIMCPSPDSSRRKDADVSPDTIIDIIKHIPNDAEHITITGGEPFLIGEKIFEIFAQLKAKFISTKFLILTNGRAFSIDSFVKKLKLTIPSKTVIGIPIHGYSESTHDYIVRANGAFYQTCLGIKNLINCNIRVELRIVVSKLNNLFIDKIAELIVNSFSGVDSVKIMGLEMTGNAFKYHEDVWIPYDLAFESIKNAIDILVNHNIDVQLYNFPLCAVEKKYHSLCAKSITDYKVRYSEKCNNCNLKDSCGGVFAGSYKFAEKDLNPR